MSVHDLPNDALAERLYALAGRLEDDDADLAVEAAVRLLMWPAPVEQINELRRRDWPLKAKAEPREPPLKRRRVRL